LVHPPAGAESPVARLSLLAQALLAWALFSCPAPWARAQDAQHAGFALDRYDPSERGSEWFVLDTLDFRGRAKLSLGGVADYSWKPLVFYDADGKEAQALVEHQLYLHVGGSLVLWDRFRLGINLPVAALVKGQPGNIGGTYYGVAEGGALGDLRISGDLRLFGRYRGPISAALGVSVWAPTGSSASYTGDGKVRVAPHLYLAGQLSKFVYGAKLAYTYRAQDGNLAGATLGSELYGAASVGLRAAGGKLLLGPEVFASTVLEDGAFSKRGTPVEGVLSAHYCIAEVMRIGAGVGTGFTRGIGSPQARALFSLEWTPCAEDKPPPADRDGDGIIDQVDACPDEPGLPNKDPKKHGCPLRDRDHDGILDDDDACPDEPGVASLDPAKHGCPLHDRDQDGILDEVDACPDLPGLASSDPNKNGCPDTDGDGIIDPKDACPNAPGPENEDPAKNGCPVARIEKGQIRILEQVKFKTDSAEILGESHYILGAVLDILNDHPELTRISIEGHTDNVGSARYNKSLSERRAASVVKWLVSNGVDPARLSSAGFGLEMPLDDNASEEGRRKNRRVEFHIREVNGKRADEASEGVEP
jgi:outer membrane protein OmpA-like peptidoglycan-associated protein